MNKTPNEMWTIFLAKHRVKRQEVQSKSKGNLKVGRYSSQPSKDKEQQKDAKDT